MTHKTRRKKPGRKLTAAGRHHRVNVSLPEYVTEFLATYLGGNVSGAITALVCEKMQRKD